MLKRPYSKKKVSRSRTGVRHALVALSLLLPTGGAFAEDIFVSSAGDISSAMSTAQPGDVLVMTDGDWINQTINFAGDGNSTNPITLRAQTPGGVKLSGTSSLSISGDYLVVDGLNFEGGTPADGSHVVRFRGSNGNATNSRLTNTQIKDYLPTSTSDRTFWVSLYGQNNRVDNSTFLNHSNSGVTVVAWLESVANNPNDIPANHRIDSNYFADRPLGTGNGFETIRIGDSNTSITSGAVVVENNLFERIDGEIEIISGKSNDNVYRYNTFRESAGTLTLRHGDGATVEGNFILGENKNNSGGIRVVGQDHKIINNYIADIDDRADGAISLTAGVGDLPLNGYKQVKNVEISHNTIVNVGGAGIEFNWLFDSNDQSLLADDVTIKNNLISSTNAALFEGSEGSGWTWENNIAHGASLGPKQSNQTGISTANPNLQFGSDGLWRPAAGSPAIDGGGAVGSITTDMDGQARIGVADIGADEFSTAQIVRMPLTSDDVGADWDGGTIVNPPTGPFVAIQAENFKQITDPDNDGDVWTIAAEESALGGFVIESPTGSRTDLSNDPHETLALYDIGFGEAGTYTAYYRARGFDGSSDSLFIPSEFDQDPSSTKSTNSNGVFEWENGGTFEITESNVGLPLELRLGRRERDTQLDAIVFHQDSGLSDSELDALFALVPGDFDEDGDVDSDDVDFFADNFGQPASVDPRLDLNNDGTITLADHDLHIETLLQTPNQSGTFIGDLNLDGDVDVSQFDTATFTNVGDASILLSNLGTLTGAGHADGDLNGDGDVDISQFDPATFTNVGDASRLLANLGQSQIGSAAGSSSAVPEPGSLVLLTLVGVACWGGSRRNH